MDKVAKRKLTFDDFKKNIHSTRTDSERQIISSYMAHIKKFSEVLKSETDKALAENRRIVCFTDFDCDGVMTGLEFKRMIPKAEVYIGDRYKDGYGIPDSGLARLQKGDLVVCCDMGSTEAEKVLKIKELTGNYPLIIDHHEVSAEMEKYPLLLNFNKKAYNIAMDKRPDWCTAGLMMQITKGWDMPDNDKRVNLIYSTFATIADVVKVNNPYDTNRQDILNGYNIINKFDISQYDEALYYFLYRCDIPEKIDTKTVQFTINPMINAPGRIGTINEHKDEYGQLISGGQFIFNMLNPYNTNPTEERVKDIDESFLINETRKKMEKEALGSPSYLAFLRNGLDKPVLVCYMPDLNKGICGRIAQTLVSTYGKPAICLCGRGNEITGSARNSEGYPNMMKMFEDALDKVIGKENIGGHPDAFGLHCRDIDIKPMTEALEEIYKYVMPKEKTVKTADLKTFTLENFGQLEPFGIDYPFPVADEMITVTKDNLSKMRDGWTSITVNNIKFFGQAKDTPIKAGQTVRVQGDLQINHYKGEDILQVSFGNDYEIQGLGKNSPPPPAPAIVNDKDDKDDKDER